MADKKINWAKEGPAYPIPERDLGPVYGAEEAQQSIMPPDQRPQDVRDMERMVRFLQDYGEAAEKEGLKWGGKFSKKDAEARGFPARYDQFKAVGLEGWDPMHAATRGKKVDDPAVRAKHAAQMENVFEALREQGWEPVATSKFRPGKTPHGSRHGYGMATDVGERSFGTGTAARSTSVLDTFLAKEHARRQQEADAAISAAKEQLGQSLVSGMGTAKQRSEHTAEPSTEQIRKLAEAGLL